jgi:hypothetical protein
MDDEEMNECKRHQICRLRSRYVFLKKKILYFINDLSFFRFYLRARRLGMYDEEMNERK